MPALLLLVFNLFTGLSTILKLAVQLVIAVFAALPGWAKLLVIVAIAGIVVYYLGDHNGANRVQTKIDASTATAVQDAVKAGSDLNAKAEASVPPLTPAQQASDSAIVPRGQPCRVFSQFDRDCQK